ncbi:unnamed protein product [Ceutorhynchus assimilis]|uniref:ER-bound oxygenase mpaB/mpaB'/Rubber oxygenase catalytic domain-containing protein n=1 Tax=Ceutorhynchus assimilis TaxID=467358 RepID=A0A9P0DD97_9CUCU|nr:unnamed protein product [Ceutorhynchus assimilis]
MIFFTKQKTMTLNIRWKFSAEEFLDNLLTKGSCAACDESSEIFNRDELPPFYNEEMYKRGQSYFHKHLFGMFLGKMLGLLCGLAIQSSLAILILTKMSSTELTAYKRYVATIFHMMIWYDSEFKPGSRLWESIKDIKSKHNSASKKASNILKYRINQKDMALTQFDFMGLALTRSNFLGIYDNDNEADLKCFVHVWRVIGYCIGIEDEFNICRESVEETRAICNEILSKVILPAVEEKNEKSREMCSYLMNGLWAINPFLNVNTFLFYLNLTLKNSKADANENNEEYKKLTKGEKARLNIIFFVTKVMQYPLVRICLRAFQIHALWVAKTFPFLAYYKFGRANSHVKIMGNH